MPTTATNKGGIITQNTNPNNYAGVDEATATQTGATTADWVVTLKTDLRTPYSVGLALTYNAKGTRNPNADNSLVVTRVDGPGKYRCSGNWPMNI